MKSYSEETPTGSHVVPARDNHESPRRSRFVTQIPAVILTAALVIGAMIWMRGQDELKHAADLKALQTQNETLQSQGDENRRQIEATTKLLKDAITRRDGEVFRTEDEIQKLNDDRITLLADMIAKKVVPAIPGPKTASEAEQLQEEQVEKVATRLTDNLRPMLSGLSAEQKEASEQRVQQYETRVHQLDQNLQIAQSAAQDALKLTHELSALYVDSFKDQGVLMRLFSLPANLMIDTAHMHLVTNRDRAKVNAELTAKMDAIDRRLREIQTAPLANKS